VIHGLVPDAPVVAAHAFQVLGEVDLEEPNPSTAVKFWFYNHPPLDERMRFRPDLRPVVRGPYARICKVKSGTLRNREWALSQSP